VIFGDSCNHFQAWRGWREELKPIVAAIDYEIDAIGGWPEKRCRKFFMAFARKAWYISINVYRKEKMEYLYANTAFTQTAGG
jgi:hypothetical protein